MNLPGTTDLMSGTGRTARSRWHLSKTSATAAALSIVTFMLYALLSLCRFRQLMPGGYDLGIFDQAVRAYSQFRAPLVPLKGAHFNILGDHFHPILMVIAPLYWLWDDPRVLLVVQAALIAASVPVVHRFAARRCTPVFAGLLTAGYALGWPLQAMANFDFHEIAFGVPLMAWAIDSLDRRADRGLLIAAGLLLLVREDMGILVCLLGFLRLADKRRPRAVPLVLMAAGVAGYLVSTRIVLPHFSTTGRFSYWTYDELGSNPATALGAIVRRPWHAIDLFFSPTTKSRTLSYLLGPLAFLSLRSRYSLIAVAVLAELFFSSRTSLWGTKYHYTAIIWTILVLAAIDAAPGLAAAGRPKRRTGTPRLADGRIGRALVAVPLVVAIAGIAFNPAVFPLHDVVAGQVFRSSVHARAQRAAINIIPPDTCVITDDRMADHLTSTNRVSLPGRLGRRPDFTLLDLSRTVTGFGTPTPRATLAQQLALGDSVVFSSSEVIVLRKSDYGGPSGQCRP